VAGLTLRRFLQQALVRPMAVVVPDVLGQETTEMPLAEDQHVIQALTAKRSREPLGKRLAVPVADQELKPAGAPGKVHQEVARLLDGPGSGRMGGDAQDVHGPGLQLHYEQDIHALEQHSNDVQDLTRQDAGRLSGQELTPRRRRPPRRRTVDRSARSLFQVPLTCISIVCPSSRVTERPLTVVVLPVHTL
jgi:hypothetical protein